MTGTITVLAIGLIMLSTSPASAKVDLERIVVEGPGLAAPIELMSEDAWEFLIGGRMVGPTGAEATAVPNGGLSVAYTVSVHQREIDEVEVLTLYPFADPAWLRLGGDTWVGRMLRGDSALTTDRWAVVNLRQIEVLRARGLPDGPPPSPSPTASPRQSPTEPAADGDVVPASSSTPVGPTTIIVLIAAMVPATALAVRGVRRRRQSSV